MAKLIICVDKKLLHSKQLQETCISGWKLSARQTDFK
jgi:hypothetical protein